MELRECNFETEKSLVICIKEREKVLAEVIRKARKERNLKQKVLAEAMKVCPSTVSRAESGDGNTFSFEFIRRFALVMELDLDRLFHGEIKSYFQDLPKVKRDYVSHKLGNIEKNLQAKLDDLGDPSFVYFLTREIRDVKETFNGRA